MSEDDVGYDPYRFFPGKCCADPKPKLIHKGEAMHVWKCESCGREWDDDPLIKM